MWKRGKGAHSERGKEARGGEVGGEKRGSSKMVQDTEDRMRGREGTDNRTHP